MRLTGILFLILLFTASVWPQALVSVRGGNISYAEGMVFLNEKPVAIEADRLGTVEEGQYIGAVFVCSLGRYFDSNLVEKVVYILSGYLFLQSPVFLFYQALYHGFIV